MPIFGTGLLRIDTGDVDYINDTISCALLTSAYTPAQTDEFASSFTGELAVSGYSRVNLASKTITHDAGARQINYDANDLLFTSLGAGATVVYAVIFKDTGNDATSPVLCWTDGLSVATDGNNLEVTVPTTGILYRQYPAA